MTIYLYQKRAVKWLCYLLLLFVYGCPGDGVTRPQQTEVNSVSLFAQHLQPLIKNYKCSNCHTESKETKQCQQNPCFAVADAKKAHDTLLSSGKVDLDNPANSPIATKVGGGHNCPAGITCDIVSNNFINAIEKWKKELADARPKIIKTDQLDLTGIDLNTKTLHYDLRHFISGPAMPPPTSPQNNTGQGTNSMTAQNNAGQGAGVGQQPATQQLPIANQQTLAGPSACPPNINICLEVDVRKPTTNDIYIIERFEIKTDTALYVKNISPLLNGRVTDNSQACAVQPPGFNFMKIGGETHVTITNKNARQQMLAFRFEQLRLATENDNACDGTKQQDPEQFVIPDDIQRIIRNYCTGNCHNGVEGMGRTLNWRTDKEVSLGEVNRGAMPRGNLQLRGSDRDALIRWLGEP